MHNHCFTFLLGITVVPKEIQDNGYAKFWGVNKVHYSLMWKWWIEHLRFALPILKKPLFQSEGKCEAIDIKMFFFFILMEMINQIISTTKVLRLGSFLELGNGLFETGL